ncbi:hypothetical protein HTY54_27430 [Escherichia coli]|nr:hypothetical protein [Escherichia coli]
MMSLTATVSDVLLIMQHACVTKKFVSLIDVMKDGSQWVNFYGVTCFHNCNSLETAAEEMQYKADKAVFFP